MRQGIQQADQGQLIEEDENGCSCPAAVPFLMRIRWTPTAADDLEHIKDYLTEHYPHLARSTVLELYEAIRSLKTFP